MEDFFDERLINKRLEELENKQPVKLPAVIPDVEYYMGIDPGFRADKPAVVVCYKNRFGELLWAFAETINRREYKRMVQEISQHFNPVKLYEEHSQ